MRKIKMIGLDLDGTLLTDRKEFTGRSKQALRAAIDSGIVVLIATGRPLTGIPEEIRSFPGMRYALTWRKKHWKSAENMIHYKRYIMTV